MKIINKLMNIQQELIAPKGQYNSFGKYSYRSCEDILEAVKPLLKKNGTALTITDEIVVMGDRTYVKATATLFDSESDETISNVAYAREEEKKTGMSESQVTGACSSYARKYALNGLFCIDDVKDADTRDNRETDDNKSSKSKSSASSVISADKVNELTQRLNADNISVEKFCELCKITSISNMTEKLYKYTISHWDTVKEKVK